MRMRMRVIGFALLICGACACPSKQAGGPAGGGSGSGSGSGSGVTATVNVDPSSCAGVRAKVEALYRAEAQQKEPKRIDDAVADNTAMVMADCAKAPAKIAPCIAGATSVAELEKACLVPVDEEGSEGDALGKHK